MVRKNVLAPMFLAAAAGAVWPLVCVAADAPRGTSDRVAELKLPPGAKSVNEPKRDNMLESLAEATSAVVKDGEFKNLVDRFVDNDRNRMDDKGGDTNFDDIRQLSRDLRNDFKQKYGKDFDFQDDDVRNKALATARVVEGEINDPAALLKAWPSDPAPGMAGATAQKASQTLRAGSDRTEDEANIEKGREIGVVRLPAAGKAPALDVSMIDEAGGWKIDVPNDRTAGLIHQDLAKHLKQLRAQKDSWPATADEAYRSFASHVMMAVYGVEAGSWQGG